MRPARVGRVVSAVALARVLHGGGVLPQPHAGRDRRVGLALAQAREPVLHRARDDAAVRRVPPSAPLGSASTGATSALAPANQLVFCHQLAPPVGSCRCCCRSCCRGDDSMAAAVPQRRRRTLAGSSEEA